MNKEIAYQMTMNAARKMLTDGLISEDEYRAFETKMSAKYCPNIGVLFSDIDLIYCGLYGNMVREKR